ncbi:MAG: hypothetical protein ABL982_19395 [Vicinamibacterales bacterium]
MPASGIYPALPEGHGGAGLQAAAKSEGGVAPVRAAAQHAELDHVPLLLAAGVGHRHLALGVNILGETKVHSARGA